MINNIRKLFYLALVAFCPNVLATETITMLDDNVLNYSKKQPYQKKMKEDLLLKELSGVKSLDLSHKNLKDEDIQMLSFNDSAGSLINIDLSGNPDLTYQSIKYISESPFIGSIRDLPQISASCGLPSSTVYVKAKDTGIISNKVKKYNTSEGIRKNFEIKYPLFSEKYDARDPVCHGVKFVECSFY